jgi:phosphatidylserine synthase
MPLKFQLLYSVIPSAAVVLFLILLLNPFGVITGWHVLGINLLLLVQAILLYRKMKAKGLQKDKLILYSVLMIFILPFQFIIIWHILGE